MVKIFDIKKVDLKYSEFDIKQLFRGLIRYRPKKFMCIHQALEEIFQKFVKANINWIKIHKVDFSTMKESFCI